MLVSILVSDFLRGLRAPSVDVDLFCNRELEIQQFIDAIAHNKSVPESKANDKKYKLITLCQAWGSGKTSFLRNCYSRACSLRPELFSGIIPLYVDVRKASGILTHDPLSKFRQAILIALRALPEAIFRQVTTAYANVGLEHVTLAGASNIVLSITKQCCLWMFDEIDLLREHFDKLWLDQLYPSLLNGHFVVCAGRSPELYLHSRGSKSIVSPGSGVCLLLDTLKAVHVDELLEALEVDTGPRAQGTSSDIAVRLFEFCGGVPRFLAICAEAVQQGIAEDKWIDYIESHAHMEASIFKNLQSFEQRVHVLKLVATSVLKIPIPLTEPFDSFAFAQLEWVNAYGLYLTRSPKQGIAVPRSFMVSPIDLAICL